MEILLQHEREKLAVMIKEVGESQMHCKEMNREKVQFYWSVVLIIDWFHKMWLIVNNCIAFGQNICPTKEEQHRIKHRCVPYNFSIYEIFNNTDLFNPNFAISDI